MEYRKFDYKGVLPRGVSRKSFCLICEYLDRELQEYDVYCSKEEIEKMAYSEACKAIQGIRKDRFKKALLISTTILICVLICIFIINKYIK